MSEYGLTLLRSLQDRVARDVQNAATFEERNRLTTYWFDLKAAIDNETETS